MLSDTAILIDLSNVVADISFLAHQQEHGTFSISRRPYSE